MKDMISEYEDALSCVGVESSIVPHITDAVEHSSLMLKRARECLVGLMPEGGSSTGVTFVAVGSVGRYEASNASDLDVAIIYDEGVINEASIMMLRRNALERLRNAGFDVSEKGFMRFFSIQHLTRNIGGEDDSNDTMTYRLLVLTEGAWVFDALAFKDFRRRLFSAYRDGGIARGRYLTSLSNDLHRYYRTVCVDYHFKIEVNGQGWGLRNAKLRHSRKTWHLANLVTHCQSTKQEPEEERDKYIFDKLSIPPILRVARVLHDSGLAALGRPLLLAYDRFLELLRQEGFRKAMDCLEYEARERSPEFRGARANAELLHLAAATIVEAYLDDPAARDYILRYGIL